MNERSERCEDEVPLSNPPARATQHGPPSNVHFVGVISENPRLQHTTVPRAHQSHELVNERFFYTIPQQLLESVCRPQDGEHFDVDNRLLQLELDLSRISGDHGQLVGFWRNLPIECPLMHATPLRREDLANLGNLSERQLTENLRQINERLLSFSEISCGYAGWLMTNTTFRAELNALLADYHQQMHSLGTVMVGLPIPSSQPPGLFNPTDEQGWTEYASAVLEFCVRWRLQGLAGPRIPIPMRPMMSGQFPLSIVSQLMRAGGVFNWPDIFPLYARDELRDLLASALASSNTTDHLSGWLSIVASQNRAKNQITALERRFRLQHFWRLLRERHPTAFARRVYRIEAAFADYFGVNDSTIRLDRHKIAEALGNDWDSRTDSP